jgi:hypothetical protein
MGLYAYIFRPNIRDQRLATKGLSTLTDFIASPLHRFVRHATAVFASPQRIASYAGGTARSRTFLQGIPQLDGPQFPVAPEKRAYFAMLRRGRLKCLLAQAGVDRFTFDYKLSAKLIIGMRVD